MLLVGLTGGIGSGKSTVAAALAERGAAVVDADRIAREVVEPGGPAYGPVVERFGPAVVGADGALDRAALAAIVFNDREALADLNRITHPAIGEVMVERTAAAGRSSPIVVLDIPLLDGSAKRRYDFGAVVVVDTPEETAVERLVRHRGFAESDARARISAQMSREERRALADVVIDNSADRDHLESQIDRLWAWLSTKAAEG